MSEKNISAIDIEKATGLNRNTVYSIVTGTSKNPSANNLYLIAQALGVTLDSLISDNELIMPTIIGSANIDNLGKEQVQAFAYATDSITKIILDRNLDITLDKLVILIKECYKYAIKVHPPHIEARFIEWLIDNKHKF